MLTKLICGIGVAAITSVVLAGPNDVWLNELHYDNVGGDVNELIEIAIGSAITASDVTVSLYNGSNGTVYNSLNAAGDMTGGQQQGDMTLYFVYLPSNGLQNGAPDGLAIDVAGSVVQFLSYEGVMMATNGPATGMTSTDIGIGQSNAPIGSSIGLIGTGSAYADFTWSTFTVNSGGQVNVGQDILPSGGGGPTTYYVNQKGNTFSPPALDVMIGDTIIWQWSSGIHTVTSGDNCIPDGLFDAPLDGGNST
ncbi:hypothetical protein H8D29_05600, partial [PVC group bacterium]|nr:hypothetical protein [PVC group bacterium]